jgi:16S rRNA (adenine1518-N6/adenine1519-N6)-dimethyltransferase
MVKAKKQLGQHFLIDQNIAKKIVDYLPDETLSVLEIGPGTGVLTKYLFQKKDIDLIAMDVDKESIDFLHQKFPEKAGQIVHADFLKTDLHAFFSNPFAVIGNFPYNISSQILFKILDYRYQVPLLIGMFQKEVAERIAAGPGSKTYGILSVLLQAYYRITYLFTVQEQAFRPPPKVKSAVIRLQRNERKEVPCNEKLFFRIVKTSFQQRRKTLRNSLKTIHTNLDASPFGASRPEQLDVEAFIGLTQWIQQNR